MNDLISRQAAKNKKVYSEERHEYVIPVAEIDWLPPAQSALPEWARKVEECRKNAPECIHNPLAWALYQVWKEYDR